MRRKGVVKWYRSNRGYGFIRYSDKSGTWHQAFFHQSDCDFSPMKGDHVCFEIKDSLKGCPQAFNIKKSEVV